MFSAAAAEEPLTAAKVVSDSALVI